jgi:hypothetical protein
VKANNGLSDRFPGTELRAKIYPLIRDSRDDSRFNDRVAGSESAPSATAARENGVSAQTTGIAIDTKTEYESEVRQLRADIAPEDVDARECRVGCDERKGRKTQQRIKSYAADHAWGESSGLHQGKIRGVAADDDSTGRECQSAMRLKNSSVRSREIGRMQKL